MPQAYLVFVDGDWKRFSQTVNEFHGKPLPEPAQPAGYAALIERYGLRLPLPPLLTAIAQRHHPLSTDQRRLLTPRHAPDATLGGVLHFA
jgi:hypothetical protein